MSDARVTRRILVVEDEALLALEVAEFLTDAGFLVVGPATSVAKALKLIREPGCDAAVLDVNLGQEHSEPIALALKTHGTPFVVLSGNSPEKYPSGFDGAPTLSKPVAPATLVALVRRCVDRVQ